MQIVPVLITGVMSSRPPRRPPEAPASWPPRPAPTGLGQTCVAGHVVSFPARSPSTPIRDRVVTLVVTSPRASLNALWRRETTVDVAFENWKAGSCILKRRVVYFETTCTYPRYLCHLIQSGDLLERFGHGSFDTELDGTILVDDNPNPQGELLHSLVDLHCFLETFT